MQCLCDSLVSYALAGSAAQSHSIAFHALPWLIISELFLRVRGLADLRSAHPCLCEIALCFSLPPQLCAVHCPCRSLLIHAVPMLSRSQRLFAFARLFPSMPLRSTASLCLRWASQRFAFARRPARCFSAAKLSVHFFSAANHLRAFPKHISSGLCLCIGSHINAFPLQSQLLLALPPHSDAFPQPCSCEHRRCGPCFAIPWRRGAFLTQRLRISTPRTSLPWHCLPALCLRIVLCALPWRCLAAPFHCCAPSDMPLRSCRCFALNYSAFPSLIGALPLRR